MRCAADSCRQLDADSVAPLKGTPYLALPTDCLTTSDDGASSVTVVHGEAVAIPTHHTYIPVGSFVDGRHGDTKLLVAFPGICYIERGQPDGRTEDGFASPAWPFHLPADDLIRGSANLGGVAHARDPEYTDGWVLPHSMP